MAADEGGILVAERNVERGAWAASLFRRRDQRRALAQHLPHRRSHLRMQDCGCMLELAVLADRGGLAVTVRRRTLDTQRSDRLLREQFAELLADRDQGREVFDIATGKG